MTSINGNGGPRTPFNTTALGNNQSPRKTSEPPTSSALNQKPLGNPTGDSFQIAAAPTPKPGTLQADAKRFTEDQLKAGIAVLEKLGTGPHIDFGGSKISGDGVITLKEIGDGHRKLTDLMEKGGPEAVMAELKKHGINIASKNHAYGIRDVVDFLHNHRKAIAGMSGNPDQVFVADDIRAMRQKGMLHKDSPPLNLAPVSQPRAQPARSGPPPLPASFTPKIQEAGVEGAPHPKLSVNGEVFEYRRESTRRSPDGSGLQIYHSPKFNREILYNPDTGTARPAK